MSNLLRPPHPPLSPDYGGEDKGEGVNTMLMPVPLFMRKAIIPLNGGIVSFLLRRMGLKGVWLLSESFSSGKKESSEKLLYALLITQISKEDYTDFPDFPMDFESV